MDSLAAAENAESHNLIGAAETKTEVAETPLLPPPLPDGNGNTMFAALTNLNAHLTALHAELQTLTALPERQEKATQARCPRSPHAARSAKHDRINGTGNRSSSGSTMGAGGSLMLQKAADGPVVHRVKR